MKSADEVDDLSGSLVCGNYNERWGISNSFIIQQLEQWKKEKERRDEREGRERGREGGEREGGRWGKEGKEREGKKERKR